MARGAPQGPACPPGQVGHGSSEVSGRGAGWVAMAAIFAPTWSRTSMAVVYVGWRPSLLAHRGTDEVRPGPRPA
jgi:hypothetical protein